MKKIFLFVLAIILGIAHIHGNELNLTKQKVVVIDAGHGGQDSGARGKYSKEKDIVLAIALKVGEYLTNNMSNVKVIYTRKTDVFIPLRERATIANNNNADLFISIHANANPNTKPYGTETFAMGLHKTAGNLEVAKKENSVIVYEEDYNTTYEGFDPNSAESYIIFSLMQNTYLEQSLTLASYVQEQFREHAQRKDRGVKQAGFLVLWNTSMPSILIETGFVTNETEEKYLMSEQGQDYLASAIYRAIKKYLTELEEKENAMVAADSLSAQKIVKKNNESENIIYRVQITSSKNQLNENHPVFKEYQNIFEYFENNLYKYALGNYTNYDQVKNFQTEVRKDFPGAFVVAFKNDKKIKLSEAIKH